MAATWTTAASKVNLVGSETAATRLSATTLAWMFAVRQSIAMARGAQCQSDIRTLARGATNSPTTQDVRTEKHPINQVLVAITSGAQTQMVQKNVTLLCHHLLKVTTIFIKKQMMLLHVVNQVAKVRRT
jgi:hypothetical protein